MLGIVYESAVIIKNNGKYYSDNFSNNVAKRYYGIDKDLMYVMPFKDCDETTKYELINYEISEAPIYKMGLNSRFFNNVKENKKLLNQYFKKCDKLIIRMPSLIGVLAISIANKQKKKYLIELVGDIRGSLKYHDAVGKILSPFFYRIMKASIKKSSNVQYITKEFLQSLYPTNGKAYICTNTSYERKDFVKKDYSAFDNKRIVLCSIGNVNVKYKGHVVVLKSIRKLIDEGYDITYVLIGGGDQKYIRENIEKLQLTDNVELLGQLPHSKVYDKLQEVDIYVQPSFTEAQGRSLLEAMNESCPCLCSDVGGMREIIPNEYRFKAGDSKQLCEIIRNLDSQKLEKMAYDNWNTAGYYSVEYSTKIREEIYNEVFK